MIQIKQEEISDIPVLEMFEEGKENQALPTVFFYHGWESRKERVLEYGYLLAKNGFRAVLPEAMDHGERSDKEDSKNEPLNFWAVVVNNVKELPILVQHYIEKNKVKDNKIRVGGMSMGGITVNAMLTQYDWIHSAAVLMGTPSPIHFSKWLLDNYKIDGTPISQLLDKEKVEAKLEELAPISLDLQPEKMNHRPIYYWHGTADPIVPFHLTKNFLQKIKDEPYSEQVIFEISEDIGHDVPQKVIKQMTSFFKND